MEKRGQIIFRSTVFNVLIKHTQETFLSDLHHPVFLQYNIHTHYSSFFMTGLRHPLECWLQRDLTVINEINEEISNIVLIGSTETMKLHHMFMMFMIQKLEPVSE